MVTGTELALVGRAREFAQNDDGMATAEYAVGTIAATGMAGILYKIITSDVVMNLLTSLLEKALSWIS